MFLQHDDIDQAGGHSHIRSVFGRSTRRERRTSTMIWYAPSPSGSG
jgi:hypothetical protein